MGIPVYFKTIVQENSSEVLHKGRLEDEINFLFLDLNCLIHPSVRGLTDETEMIEKILNDIGKLIEYTQVTDLLYIAIDGIPPKGKMKQQRERRFKSCLERKYSSTLNSWNTNAISPGTRFMEKLNTALKGFISPVTMIVSDSSVRGEGEHKILQYIKSNNLEGKTCVYGLDADLIMLSLASKKKDIVLLRERTEYNFEKTDEEFIYLQIDPLKKHIISKMGLDRVIDEDQVIDDYIFICFLLGNDFMNHVPSLNLRYGGHDLLLHTYSVLQNRYQGYFQLVNKETETFIHMTFFKEFIKMLADKERDSMMRIISIRERQYRNVKHQYQNEINLLTNHVNDENLFIEDIYRIKHENIDNKCISKMIEDIPIIYSANEKQIYREMIYNTDLTQDYFDSLVWTCRYYFDECYDWRWTTLHNSGPLLEHLYQHLDGPCSMGTTIQKNDKEFTYEELLAYIFPNDSHNLHNFQIKTDDYMMRPHLSFNRYLWECHSDFILKKNI